MKTLDFLDELTLEPEAFNNHPVKELPLEHQILYLMGLALVMSADGCLHDKQQDYIRLLIKSLELDNSLLDDVTAFARSPDKETASGFLKTFRRNPLAKLFLFDAFMLSMQDGELHEQEKAVIDKLADQLEVLKGTRQDIFDLFCHIKNKDWNESSLYFSSHILNPKYFKHLLDYYDIELQKLLNRTSKLRSVRLREKVIPHITLVLIPEEQNEDMYKRLARKEIESSISGSKSDLLSARSGLKSGFLSAMWEMEALSNPQHKLDLLKKFLPKIAPQDFFQLMIKNSALVPYIQSRLDRKQFRVIDNKICSLTESQDEAFLSLETTGIHYDPVARFFTVNPDKADQFVTLSFRAFKDFREYLDINLMTLMEQEVNRKADNIKST